MINEEVYTTIHDLATLRAAVRILQSSAFTDDAELRVAILVVVDKEQEYAARVLALGEGGT